MHLSYAFTEDEQKERMAAARLRLGEILACRA